MPYDVLALSAFRPIPPEVMGSDLVGTLMVITEPAYADRYGPDVDVYTVPNLDDFTAVRDTTLSILSERHIDAVLCPTELGIGVGGLLRSYFGIPGMGYETANAFSNKYVMKQRMAAAGLPVTPFRLVPRLRNVPDAAAEIGWPLVVKTCFGGGSLHVTVLGSQAEFVEFYGSPRSASLRNAPGPLIAEKFVDIRSEYHCDGIVYDGTTQFASVSRYVAPVLRGIGDVHGSYYLRDDAPETDTIRGLHEGVIRALGMSAGVTHFEVLETSSGFLVGEIGCRPAGGGAIVRSIALQYGIDMWQAYMETSLGLKPAARPTVSRSDTILNLILPAQPGRVVDISSEEDFRALPNVVDTKMLLKKGDIVDDIRHSLNITGRVLLSADSEADVDKLVRRVTETYALRVEPVEDH